MTREESRFVDNDGVTIHYLDSHPVDETVAPVIFVPGMTCVAADYEEMVPALGRRCIVIELRGHGLSDSPEGGYTLADHATDVDAVVREVTDGPVHLMTFSRGTCYALAWAAANPDRVRSLAFGDYPAREIALPGDAAENLLAGRWRGTPVLGRLSELAARQTFADAHDRPLWDELCALDVPLLVVRSGADGPLTDADWARYRRDHPTAELHEFADSPHDLFRDDRTRFAHLVRTHVEAAEVAPPR